MKTKIQIKTTWGSLLYEAEENSVKKTIEEAVKNGVNLHYANLLGADLRGADLRGANLRNADLGGANLCGANLSEADICGVDLRGADICGVDLRGAALRFANLSGTNLLGTDLRGTNLYGVNLRGADICDANLSGANLLGADLGEADLGKEWGKIEKSSDLLCVGSIGSRNDCTTIFHTDKGIFVKCGCFRGTLDEFAAQVKETHAGTKHERDYNALIEFVKIKFSDYTSSII